MLSESEQEHLDNLLNILGPSFDEASTAEALSESYGALSADQITLLFDKIIEGEDELREPVMSEINEDGVVVYWYEE